MNTEVITLHDRVDLPAGFQAAGLGAGIKKNGKKDLALIVSDTSAAAAGIFTTNQVQAASVKLCRERLAQGTARAIVINSGNANACTGERGMKDARKMGAIGARALGLEENDVLVCSTGHIGACLPMDVVEKGIETAASQIGSDHGLDAAEAIMTTDTRPKYCTTQILVEGKPVTLTGLAKGAGMIEPNMATMLSFLMTDAAVDPAALQTCLKYAADQSFNRISVDGDRSTNDTVLFLANGSAGHAPLDTTHPDWPAFKAAVFALTHDLAMKIMRDGEGVTKVVTIRVQGAVSNEEADCAARSVGNSLLVKTSWVGNFPNWGRVMDALGYSAATIQEDRVDIAYDGLPATAGGLAASTPLDELKKVIERSSFTIDIDLHVGDGEAIVYSCDCTEEYVKINR